MGRTLNVPREDGVAANTVTMDKISDILHATDGDVLHVHLVGRASVSMFFRYAMNKQELWAEHDKVIYDLTQWDTTGVTPEVIQRLPERAKSVQDLCKPGRTALLVPDSMIMLARVIAALFDTTGASEVETFTDRQQALKWLSQLQTYCSNVDT